MSEQLSRKRIIDRGYGGRFDGKHSPTENRRIEIGVPERVKSRITLQISPDKTMDETLDISDVPVDLQDRLGRCYELCGKVLLANRGKGWRLVHATLFPYIGKDIYFHAFLEKDNIIYDAVANKFYDADSYYQVYYIEDVRRYTEEEATIKMLKSGHYGSWD